MFTAASEQVHLALQKIIPQAAASPHKTLRYTAKWSLHYLFYSKCRIERIRTHRELPSQNYPIHYSWDDPGHYTYIYTDTQGNETTSV